MPLGNRSLLSPAVFLVKYKSKVCSGAVALVSITKFQCGGTLFKQLGLLETGQCNAGNLSYFCISLRGFLLSMWGPCHDVMEGILVQQAK